MREGGEGEGGRRREETAKMGQEVARVGESQKIVELEGNVGQGDRDSEDSEYEDFDSVVNPKFGNENQNGNAVHGKSAGSGEKKIDVDVGDVKVGGTGMAESGGPRPGPPGGTPGTGFQFVGNEKFVENSEPYLNNPPRIPTEEMSGEAGSNKSGMGQNEINAEDVFGSFRSEKPNEPSRKSIIAITEPLPKESVMKEPVELFDLCLTIQKANFISELDDFLDFNMFVSAKINKQEFKTREENFCSDNVLVYNESLNFSRIKKENLITIQL